MNFKSLFYHFSRHIKTQQQKPVPQRETDTEYDEGSSIIISCYILLFILIDVTASPAPRSRLSHSSDDWFLSFLPPKHILKHCLILRSTLKKFRGHLVLTCQEILLVIRATALKLGKLVTDDK